ncbi:hypothetical protein ACP4OV_000378 [Aristida adscensionis]
MIRMAAMTASTVFCFSLLLLLPHLGNTYHIVNAHASRQFVVRSSHNSSAASMPRQTCPSVSSGAVVQFMHELDRSRAAANGNRLPLFHRLSPCSPLDGAPKRVPASSVDVVKRDAHRLRAFLLAAAAPAPAPGVAVPVSVSDSIRLRGALDYNLVVGYGTPPQLLPMSFDTFHRPIGFSTLRCRPCSPGADGCDARAFDPAKSSTFSRVACGPECPAACDGPDGCLLRDLHSGTLVENGTFVKDTLALSPSATFPNFVLACMDVDTVHNYTDSIGTLDLSRDRFSLAGQVSSSLTNGSNIDAGFSYCLPSTRSLGGFLSIGGALPDLTGNGAGSTHLVQDRNHTVQYLIHFSGINVAGTEVPVLPQGRLAALDVGVSFTFLMPAFYTALRDEFRRQMAKYPPAPPYRTLDTCYNLTGLPEFDVPVISLEFEGGATLQPGMEQMMFFPDASAAPFTYGCLAFAPMPNGFGFSVVGNMAQQTTEVVYDVRGGRVGFIPRSC